MTSLSESEKSALVWEIQEKAIDLYIRRWKFRIGLAIGVILVVTALLGLQLDPWMQAKAEKAMDVRIEEMTELERDTIRLIKQDQAIAFQGVISSIEKTKSTTEATLKEADELSLRVEREMATMGKTQEEVNELVNAISVLKERRDQLPTLAKALDNIDSNGLQLEQRLQTVEERRTEWPDGSYCILKSGACPVGFSENKGALNALWMYRSSNGYVVPSSFGDSWIKNHVGKDRNHDSNDWHGEIVISTCCK